MKAKTSLKILAIALIIHFSSSSDFHVSCQTTQECSEPFNEFYECISNVCKNEQLIRISNRSIIGIALIIVVSSIANAGGIGGGAILSAVYIVLFKFSIGDSIPLSHATIFSGALMNFSIIFNKRQTQDPTKFVIDYKLASLILPLMLGGALIGVILNKVLPSIFVLCMLATYLIIKTYTFFYDAKMISEKEKMEKEVEKYQNNLPLVRKESRKIMEEKLIELATFTPRDSFNKGFKDRRLNQSAPNETLLYKSETFQEHWSVSLSKIKVYLFFCFGSYLIILVTMLLRGGKAFQSIIGIGSCSATSWIILIISQGLLLGMAWLIFQTQQKEPKQISPFTFPSIIAEDFNNESSIKSMMFDSYKAGLIAGTLGLGGGLILVPMLINKKYLPEIASAVSGFLVLVTSFSTTSQFLIMGAFDIKSTLVIIVSSGLGSFIGTKLINYAIAKYDKPSLIMWVVFAILLISAIVLPYVGILNLIQNPNIIHFSSPC